MSSKMRRIRWIDEQIRANRYPNAHKVKEKFELRSTRVVYEDRNYMVNELHAPIEYSRTKEGWYYTVPTYFLPAIMLKKEEVAAHRQLCVHEPVNPRRYYVGPLLHPQ